MKIIKSGLIFLLLISFCSPSYAGSGHELFDQLLKEHVSLTGQVDYVGIKSDPRFVQYLDYLAHTNPARLSREGQLAFWINAYNALAIKGIIDGRSPSNFFGRIGFFKTSKYHLANKSINLNDLERDILIPFNEARIHFAIVCASKSCPSLLAEAYTADRLEQQLEENTYRFINDPLKNQFDQSSARISKIFDWFADDFMLASGSVPKFLAQYIADKKIAERLMKGRLRLSYLKYDWSLNGIKP